MTKRLKTLSIAIGITFVVGVIAIIAEMILSTACIHGNDIGACAGGLSQRFFTLLLLWLLILFVTLILLFGRARRSGARRL